MPPPPLFLMAMAVQVIAGGGRRSSCSKFALFFVLDVVYHGQPCFQYLV